MKDPIREPAIFIRDGREYSPEEYPFKTAPDTLVYCGRELTYREFVATVLAQRALKLRPLNRKP